MTVNVPKEKASSKNLFKIIGIAACIVVLIGFLVKTFASDKPIEVVEKFITAVNDKDINKAVTYLDPKYEKLYKASSKVLSKVLGAPELSDIADILPGFSQLAGSKDTSQITIEKVISQDVQKNTATIKVLLNFKEKDDFGTFRNDRSNGTFTLKKINGKWKIVNMR